MALNQTACPGEGNGKTLLTMNRVGLTFDSSVTWRRDSTLHTCAFSQCSDTVRLERSVLETENGYRLSLKVRNISGDEILIEAMDLLRIDSAQALDLGVPWSSIQVYTHGRHKNDIPYVIRLDASEASRTAVKSGLRENGTGFEVREEDLRVRSDTMTLLKGEDRCLLLGYSGGDRLFCRTTISLDGSSPALISGCTPNVVLKAGQTLESEELLIRAGEDWHSLTAEWAEEKAERFGVPQNRRPAPAVFCTWYYYGLTISWDDIRENLEQIRKKRIPYDVFQIDEGWEKSSGSGLRTNVSRYR